MRKRLPVRAGAIASWYAALFATWIFAFVVSANAAPTPSSATEGDPDPLLVEGARAAEVIPAVAELAEQSADATALLERMTDVQDDMAELELRAELLEGFELYLSRHRDDTFVRSRLVAVRERIDALRRRLAALMQEVGEDLEQVNELETRWATRRDGWSELRRSLASSTEYRQLRPHLRQATSLIQGVLQAIEPTSRALLEVQHDALQLRTRADRILASIDGYLLEQRAERFVRGEPPLVAATSWSGLDDPDALSAWRADLMTWDGAFLLRARRVLLLHAIGLVALVLIAGRLRRARRPPPIAKRPLAAALFVPTALASAYYHPMPAWWEIGVWCTLGISGARLARVAVSGPRMRVLALALAVAYPTLVVLETVGLPAVLLRALLVLTSAIGVVIAVRMMTGLPRAGRGAIRRAALVVVAVILTASGVAETLGYEALSRFVFAAALKSGFVVLTAAVLWELLRGSAVDVIDWMQRHASVKWRDVIGELGSRVEWLLAWFVVAYAGLYVLYLWELLPPPAQTWDRFTRASFTLFGLEISVAKVLLAAVVLYLARQIARVLELVLEGTVLRGEGFDTGVVASIQTLIRYCLIAIGFVVAMGVLGIELRNVAIVAGALGVGIGFGLQNVVADFTSGLILLFERPLRPGDALIIDGQWGRVEKIGLRSTLIRLVDESELVVPNSHMTSEKLQNWTLSSQAARVFCPVGVAYGSDLEKVFSTLEQVAQEHEDVVEEPPPEVLFMAFGESSLQFELRVWIRSADFRLSTRSSLLRNIDRAFRAAGIVIAFPQLDLHVKSTPRDEEDPRPLEDGERGS